MPTRPEDSAPRAGRAGAAPAGSPGVPAWKAVALPVEHGGWGLLGEPVVLGLALASSVAGGCLALAALAAFLVRHPLRLALMDRRRGTRHPRTALAEKWAAGYGVLALMPLLAAFALASSPFWPALLAALPLAAVVLGADLAGRSREAWAEAAGAVALCFTAAALALAGGAAAPQAFAATALLALRAVGSVFFVRARIRLDRGLAASPAPVLAGHGAALFGAALLALLDAAPWLGVAAFVMLLARAALGLAPGRRPLRPQALGFRELGYGLVTLLLLAIGYRAGP